MKKIIQFFCICFLCLTSISPLTIIAEDDNYEETTETNTEEEVIFSDNDQQYVIEDTSIQDFADINYEKVTEEFSDSTTAFTLNDYQIIDNIKISVEGLFAEEGHLPPP